MTARRRPSDPPPTTKSCAICGATFRRDPGQKTSRWLQKRYCTKSCASKARWDTDPHCVAGRTLVARTCLGCAILLPASEFRYQPARRRYAVRCGPCQWSKDTVRPGKRESHNESTRRNRYRKQAETAPTAHHHYQQWTGPELELAARADLTAAEIATRIGRTHAAVASARRRLRHDPKWIQVVGLARSALGASDDGADCGQIDADGQVIEPTQTVPETYGGLVIDRERCAYCAAWPESPCALHSALGASDDGADCGQTHDQITALRAALAFKDETISDLAALVQRLEEAER